MPHTAFLFSCSCGYCSAFTATTLPIDLYCPCTCSVAALIQPEHVLTFHVKTQRKLPNPKQPVKGVEEEQNFITSQT